jgi:prolyl-tRNA editing enzyme YbaK/EbsC (Cys-tRNA(Pro) deacylase)
VQLADLADEKVRRVVSAAAHAGVAIAPVTFERETRTSVDAAREIGCSVAEIVKSLVFRVAGTLEPVLLLLSGADRADLSRAAAILGVDRLERASPEAAKAATGYSIGATPPFGLATSLLIAMDDRLLEFDHVWAAGGRTDTVFQISSRDLTRVTGAVVATVREVAGTRG